MTAEDGERGGTAAVTCDGKLFHRYMFVSNSSRTCHT